MVLFLTKLNMKCNVWSLSTLMSFLSDSSFKAGASIFYCTYVLRISGWPEKLGFRVSAMTAKTEILLRFITTREKQILTSYWNPKTKLGVIRYFSEIRKFKFSKTDILCFVF